MSQFEINLLGLNIASDLLGSYPYRLGYEIRNMSVPLLGEINRIFALDFENDSFQ